MSKGIVETQAATLEREDKVIYTATGLILNDDLTFNEWWEIGPALQQIVAAGNWWLGDWLNYGERRYGETYSQALEQTNLDYQTLKDATWVARNVEKSRRRDFLSWSHHREVAPLSPTQQEEWLERADAEGLSVHRLRRALKHEKASQKREERRQENAELAPSLDSTRTRYDLHHGPCRDALEAEPDSMDWVVTDPPYPREYLHVYDDLADVAAHALKPGGSLLCMVGQSYLPDVMERLSKRLTYHWTLAYLTPGGQATQQFPRRINTFWKPVLWFTKGEYDGEWIGDVTKSNVNDNDKTRHHWGQSESGMADLMRRFVQEGDRVLDPFMGACTTGVIALELGAFFAGYDIDEDAFNEAVVRMDNADLHQ